MIRAWLGLMGALCLSCGGGAAPGGATAPGAFGAVPGRPDATRWLGADTARARSAGAGDSEVIAVDAGAPGDRVTGLVRVPPGDCVLLIARAADSVEDIDLYAYGDDGTALGSDEAPDRSPTLLVCPPHPARIFVMARIAAGHGMVAVGAQRVPQKDGARVRRALAARAAQNPSAWPELDQTLADHRRRLGGRWQEVRRTALPVDVRVTARLSAALEPDQCFDFLVLPSEEVSHLDVALSDESGRIVGRAVAAGRERFVLACSATRANVSLEVRPQSGRGVAGVVISKSGADVTLDLPAAPLAFGLPSGVELPAARRALAERTDALGLGEAKTIAEGRLDVGRRSSSDLVLPGGCGRVDVVAGKPTGAIESWLWSERGDLLAHSRGAGTVTLHGCGGGKARLDVEAVALPGPFAAELRSEPNAPAVATTHPLAASRLMGRWLARGVARTAEHLGAPRAATLGAESLERFEVRVPRGRCVEVGVGLGAGASGAELSLIDARSGAEVDRAQGAESVSLRHCALNGDAVSALRAEVRVARGSTTALIATRMLSPKP